MQLSNTISLRRDVYAIRSTVTKPLEEGRIIHPDFLDIDPEGWTVTRQSGLSTFRGTYDGDTRVFVKKFDASNEEVRIFVLGMRAY